MGCGIDMHNFHWVNNVTGREAIKINLSFCSVCDFVSFFTLLMGICIWFNFYNFLFSHKKETRSIKGGPEK